MEWNLVVKDVGELRGHMEPVGWNQSGASIEPHVALLGLGGKPKDSDLEREAQKTLQDLDGDEVTFDVTAVLKHEDLIVAEVDLPEDVPCTLTLAHMVLWHSQRVSPGLAYELLRDPARCADSLCFDPPITLKGIITGEKKDDPSCFEGKFMKIETQPLATKQAEPKGTATFLREEEADEWKTKLASSIKDNPAGPEGCKLKANVQGAGRPGHIYLRWGAAFSTMTAKEITKILEDRLQELME